MSDELFVELHVTWPELPTVTATAASGFALALQRAGVGSIMAAAAFDVPAMRALIDEQVDYERQQARTRLFATLERDYQRWRQRRRLRPGNIMRRKLQRAVRQHLL
jgi:hypothetical protein